MVINLKRILYLAGAVLMLTVLTSFILPKHTYAVGVLEPRSLTLQADPGATTVVGGSTPGGTVDDLFTFTVPSADQSTAIESIGFQYCEQADSTCGNLNTDYSMSTTGVSTTPGSATSSSLSSCTVSATTQLDPILNCSTAVTPGSSPLTVQLVGVVNPNPTAPNQNLSFYVRITTWTLTNEGGTNVDSGNVAAAVANPIVLSGQMPESLVFCTGGTVSETSGVPDCTTATSGAVSFQQLFSPNYTSVAISQMAASTNATSGYQITVLGPTLTSGSNKITAIGATAAAPVKGTDQFGMNLVANTTATNSGCGTTYKCGTAITPASDGTSYFALPASNYATPDTYAFAANTTTVVATSGYPSGTTVGTDAQIYTSTYIANVQGLTPAGTYTTTLTYICTPTF